MSDKIDVVEKRRALLDAIYAIHAGDGQIRIDETLARRLDQAWDEYDSALVADSRRDSTDEEVIDILLPVQDLIRERDELRAEVERLRDENTRLDALIDRGLFAEVERLRTALETAAAMVRSTDPDLADALLRRL